MDNLPFFDPTRPPPPTLPTPFNDPLIDQNIVQQFLSTRPQWPSTLNINQSAPVASITGLRTEFTNLIAEVNLLKTNKDALEKTFVSLSDSEWADKMKQLELLQSSVESKLLRLNGSNQLKLLGKKLHVRRKKRAWLKRRNCRFEEEKEEAMQNRAKLHAQIDQWQREQAKLVEKEKQNQQELEYASHFLADVHRRKAACKRNLARFGKMKERTNSGQTTQADIEELIRTWAANLSDCIKEEKRLKDVLARKSAANYQRRVENEWTKALFGDAISKKFEHPLLGADRNREELISIRRDWDACLVDQYDEGSAIPLGWVLPPVSPAADWAKYQIADVI